MRRPLRPALQRSTSRRLDAFFEGVDAKQPLLAHLGPEPLTEAIAAGGSTLRDFVNTSGEPGYFQLDYFVYGRDGEPCRTCGMPLKLMRHGGRATVFCSVCQR